MFYSHNAGRFKNKPQSGPFMKHETLLTKQPSLLSLYTRALFKRASESIKTPNIPTLVFNTKCNQKQLKQYKNICNDTTNQSTLPPLYPQILAFRLHLELLLNKQLPFPVMGLVHRNNHVDYFSPISLTDDMTIKVGLDQYDENNKGINCTVFTQVYVDGNLKWQARSTYFYRKRKTIASNARTLKNTKILKETHNVTTWSLPANLGRQYAKITGDLNPIHLYALSAKLFGFKQTIIHGMCMAAKATAQAQPVKLTFPHHVYIEFNKPVYLPDEIVFTQTKHDFSICPIIGQQVMDSPMLSGRFETGIAAINTHAI